MLQVVLRLAANRGRIEAGVQEKINEFAGRGFRALGLAVSEGASGQPRFVPALLQDGPAQASCNKVHGCISQQ